MTVAEKKPLTVVAPAEHVTVEQMAQRIIKTRDAHGDMLQQYHEVWYQSEHTWHYNHFLGVGLMKSPTDLWMYQILMTEYRPLTVIETGTYKGGSALWFAFLMDMLKIDGKVFTVDIEDYRQCDHPRITFLGGDSTDAFMRDAIEAELPDLGRRLIVLDADHSAEHVYQELCLYAPLCRVGDWLIVEDTNISWAGVGPDGVVLGDRGARGGVEDYLNEHPNEFRQDVTCERFLLTMNPGGFLQRMA